jgi:hypothetical protein
VAGKINMNIKDSLSHRYLRETIGLPVNIISNDYSGFQDNEYQKIVFQVNEEDPDIFSLGILYSLSLLSFTYAAPRGYSENIFKPDEEWSFDYFLEGLEFIDGTLKYSGDYVSGRHMKTTIVYTPGGLVSLTTRNRGKGADRWVSLLQGRKHINPLP